MLVALLCAPGLVEQATQDPAVLDRLRTTGYVAWDLYKVGDGPPPPVRVFFAGNGVWQRHFDDPATRTRFMEAHTNAWWAAGLVRSWSTSTDEERRAIEENPTWVSGLDWPDWLGSDDAIETVTLDSVDRLVPGREAIPRAFRFERPFRISPQQEAVVRALGPLFELREGGARRLPDLQNSVGRFDNVVNAALRAAYGQGGGAGRSRMVKEVINGLKVQGRNFHPGGLFLCDATPSLPATAVVLPWDDSIRSGSALTPQYPVILTPDVVRRFRTKRRSGLVVPMGSSASDVQGKWVVVTTSTSEVQMRSADPQALENSLRVILLRSP